MLSNSRAVINEVRLDDPMRPYVIAEASGNHNQDYGQAVALIVEAANAGADAIKFQTFTAEEICADIPFPYGHDSQHDAWARSLGVVSLRDLFSKGGLPRQWHKPLKALADELGIAFLSTPFSVDAARFLVEDVGVKALKIASGDLTFTPLLDYAAGSELPVILSTGGSTEDEVYAVVSSGRMWAALDENRLVIMHCLSIYPSHEVFTNLRAIQGMKNRMRSSLIEKPSCIMGFSDHTLSVDMVPALAVACGATVLEKHLCLEYDTSSIDIGHSLTPSQMKTYIQSARSAAEILGHGRKEPHALEMHDRLWARRDPSDWLRPTREAREGRWE